MRFTLALLLLLSLAGCNRWKPFSPPEGGCRVQMPGTPVRGPGVLSFGNTYVAKSGGAEFRFAVMELPVEDREQAIAEWKQRMASGGSRFDSAGSAVTREVPMAGGTATEMEITVSLLGSGGHSVTRYLLKGARIYTFAVEDEGTDVSAARQRFFDSFREE